MRKPYNGMHLALAAASALVLAACGSGGIDDVLGGGYPQQQLGEVRGTVRGVDTSGGDCAIELASDATYDSRLRDRGSVVFCDQRTEVVYQGRSYRPEALEPGDRITARVREVGNRLLAEHIEVLYDVSRGDDRYRYPDTRYPDTRYPDDRAAGDPSVDGDLRGTVYRVDTNRRTLELERVRYYDRDLERYGRDDDRLILDYDADTLVRYAGRSYRPENLERGDVVEVEIDTVRGRMLASDITVLSDVRERSATYPD